MGQAGQITVFVRRQRHSAMLSLFIFKSTLVCAVIMTKLLHRFCKCLTLPQSLELSSEFVTFKLSFPNLCRNSGSGVSVAHATSIQLPEIVKEKLRMRVFFP